MTDDQIKQIGDEYHNRHDDDPDGWLAVSMASYQLTEIVSWGDHADVLGNMQRCHDNILHVISSNKADEIEEKRATERVTLARKQFTNMMADMVRDYPEQIAA